MKAILITANGDVKEHELIDPAWKSISFAVKGSFEIARTQGLCDPYVMIVNEDGHYLNLKSNGLASLIYGGNVPIVGDVLICKQGYNSDGDMDIIGLEPEELNELLNSIRDFKFKLR